MLQNVGAGDLLTGYLEKRIGENSGRQSLPEAWRWQKRYFVLTEPKGMLYYFKSADDPPNYKGLINMRECKVSFNSLLVSFFAGRQEETLLEKYSAAIWLLTFTICR